MLSRHRIPTIRSGRHGPNFDFTAWEVLSARSSHQSRHPRRPLPDGDGRRLARRRQQSSLRLRPAAHLPGPAGFALGRRSPDGHPLHCEHPLRRPVAADPACDQGPRRQGELEVDDPREGEARVRNGDGDLRQGRKDRKELRGGRPADGARANHRAEERLLAARLLLEPEGELRHRALQPVARERRARGRRARQLPGRDEPRRRHRHVERRRSRRRDDLLPRRLDDDPRRVPGLEDRDRHAHRRPAAEEEARARLLRHPRSGAEVGSRLDRRRRRPDPERQSDHAAEGDERLGSDLRLRRQRHRRLDGPELGSAPAGRPRVLPVRYRRRCDPVRPGRLSERIDARRLPGNRLPRGSKLMRSGR